MGRPSRYSDALVDGICERLAGGESLVALCRDATMPGLTTVFRWLADPERQAFRERYALAREAQADRLFDEMLGIADDATNDWMVRNAEKGGPLALNSEHIQRSKLRLDTRKWMAARLAPKKYGDKMDVTSGGEKLAGAPVHPLTAEERRAALAGELGDVLWYLAQVATEARLDLAEVAGDNLAKLRSRQERQVLRGSGDDR